MGRLHIGKTRCDSNLTTESCVKMSLTKEQDEKIAELFREMYPKLLSIAYHRLGAVPPAEEAAQETFCIACRRVDACLESDNPQGWLVTTLLYVIRNMQRFAATQAQRVVPDPNYRSAPGVPDDYSEIEFADLISEEDFRLFRRVAVDRYTIREAAQELGIREEACKKRVQRIRAKLQKKILRDMQADSTERS